MRTKKTLTQTSLFQLRALKPGEQLSAETDIVLVHEESTGYRCVGSMWCGAEQWLLLVRPEQVEQIQTSPKRVVSRELVRVVEVAS